MTVLRAIGVESEMALAYASLHQLSAPLLDRIEDIPVPQREALRVVFGTGSFTAIGMEAFAERARLELQATGEHVRGRSVETRDDLTAQEWIGMSFLYNSQLDHAARVADRLEALVGPGDSALAHAMCSNLWAIAAIAIQDYETAETAASAAIGYYEQPPYWNTRGYMANIEGLALLARGETHEAVTVLQKAVADASENHLVRMLGFCATNLAWGHLYAADYDAATLAADRLASNGITVAATRALVRSRTAACLDVRRAARLPPVLRTRPFALVERLRLIGSCSVPADGRCSLARCPALRRLGCSHCAALPVVRERAEPIRSPGGTPSCSERLAGVLIALARPDSRASAIPQAPAAPVTENAREPGRLGWPWINMRGQVEHPVHG